jgi:hypothetical protein
MLDRNKLELRVCERYNAGKKDRQLYAAVYLEGVPIVVSEDLPPGPQLLQAMDRMEILIRHVQAGANWATAYFTVFKSFPAEGG